MNRREKKFDAVAMMRSIRDKVSAKIEGMTLEEELEWLASQQLKDPFLERLRDRATQPAAPIVKVRALAERGPGGAT